MLFMDKIGRWTGTVYCVAPLVDTTMSAASDSAGGHLFGLLIFREPSEEGLWSLHNLVCYPFTPSSVRSFPVSVSKFSVFPKVEPIYYWAIGEDCCEASKSPMMPNVLPNPVDVSGGQLPVGSQPHSFRVCPNERCRLSRQSSKRIFWAMIPFHRDSTALPNNVWGVRTFIAEMPRKGCLGDWPPSKTLVLEHIVSLIYQAKSNVSDMDVLAQDTSLALHGCSCT